MGVPRWLLLVTAIWLATVASAMNTASKIAFISSSGMASALLRSGCRAAASGCSNSVTRLLARNFASRGIPPRGFMHGTGGTQGKQHKTKPRDPWDGTIARLPKAPVAKKRSVAKHATRDSGSMHTGAQHSCSICAIKAQLMDFPVVGRAKELMKNRYKVPFPVILGSQIFHWRTQAKLACQPMTRWGGGVEIGMFKEGTHDLEPIYECMSHHAAINRATNIVRDECKATEVTGYNERTGEGSLRYLHMSVERTSGQVQLTLVWNAETVKQALQEASMLVKKLKTGSNRSLFHSIWLNNKPADGESPNAILKMDPAAWRHLYGKKHMEEKIGNATVALNPQLFRQANLEMFDDIAREVVRHVPYQANVCELYAGVGVLGLNALLSQEKQVKVVRCSDSNPWLEEHFNISVGFLPEELRAKITFTCQTAADAIAAGQANECDVLIVDPPRKGLEPSVLQELCTPKSGSLKAIRTLIYVSCGFDALERELAELSSHGWKLKSAKGYLMFPGTNHIETVAVLER